MSRFNGNVVSGKPWCWACGTNYFCHDQGTGQNNNAECQTGDCTDSKGAYCPMFTNAQPSLHAGECFSSPCSFWCDDFCCTLDAQRTTKCSFGNAENKCMPKTGTPSATPSSTPASSTPATPMPTGNYCPAFASPTGVENYNGAPVSGRPGCYQCAADQFCKNDGKGGVRCASACIDENGAYCFTNLNTFPQNVQGNCDTSTTSPKCTFWCDNWCCNIDSAGRNACSTRPEEIGKCGTPPASTAMTQATPSSTAVVPQTTTGSNPCSNGAVVVECSPSGQSQCNAKYPCGGTAMATCDCCSNDAINPIAGRCPMTAPPMTPAPTPPCPGSQVVLCSPSANSQCAMKFPCASGTPECDCCANDALTPIAGRCPMTVAPTPMPTQAPLCSNNAQLVECSPSANNACQSFKSCGNGQMAKCQCCSNDAIKPVTAECVVASTMTTPMTTMTNAQQCGGAQPVECSSSAALSTCSSSFACTSPYAAKCMCCPASNTIVSGRCELSDTTLFMQTTQTPFPPAMSAKPTPVPSQTPQPSFSSNGTPATTSIVPCSAVLQASCQMACQSDAVVTCVCNSAGKIIGFDCPNPSAPPVTGTMTPFPPVPTTTFPLIDTTGSDDSFASVLQQSFTLLSLVSIFTLLN